jgi:hypothetical protein
MNKVFYFSFVLFVTVGAMEDAAKADGAGVENSVKSDTGGAAAGDSVKPDIIVKDPKPTSVMEDSDNGSSSEAWKVSRQHFMDGAISCGKGFSSCLQGLGKWGAEAWGRRHYDKNKKSE